MKEETSENPRRVEATQQLRRSGAAGAHADRRERRVRTRSAQLRKEVSEQEDV